MSDVGFIGLGVMGGPMAGHVLAGLAAESSLLVTDVDRGAAEALIRDGALWAASAREIAERCGVVVVMVPSLVQVRAVLDGPDGLLAGVRSPLVLVIGSTDSPQGVRDLADDLDELTGGLVSVLDAPVSGGQSGAEGGTLAIMVGGPDDLVARVAPLLGLMGTVAHLGPLGSGQVGKACNQLIVAAELAAIAEASIVAERAGLDVAQLLGLLQGGYAGSVVLADKATRFAEHDYRVSGAAGFLVKDLAAYRAEADRTGTPTLLADRLHEAYAALTDEGMGRLDSSVIQAWLAARRG